MFAVRGHELTARQLHDLLALRIDVFVVEQNCPYREVDGHDLDPTTEHLWTADELGIASALRILEDGSDRRIGRVVTRADQRGNGAASALLSAALEHLGSTSIVLDAQSYLQEFYERFGFTVTGPEFVEDGIPHVPMRRPGAGATQETMR